MTKHKTMTVTKDFESGDELGHKIVEKNVERNNKTDSQEFKKKKKNKTSKSKMEFDVIDAGKFSIIPCLEVQKKQIVHRNLPHWLTHPTSINPSTRDGSVEVKQFIENIKFFDEDVAKVLEENKIESFFPVQQVLIRELLSNADELTCQLGRGGSRDRDLCCSAPTGSGKTLAYVIPLVQILIHRTFPAIRCLVVVPGVDLAMQVFKVFKMFTPRTGVKVGLAIGQESFSKEQSRLLKEGAWGFESKVDVLVCTPGRLVDHIVRTDGFNLTQLRYLVIDEADRMMEEVKQDWLEHLERAIWINDDTCNCDASFRHDRLKRDSVCSCVDPVDPLNPPRARPFLPSADYFQTPRVHLQKLLFSATLSHNPEKLQALGLYCPKFFTTLPISAAGAACNKRKRNDSDDGGGGQVDGVTDEIENKKSKTIKNELLGKYVTPPELTENFMEIELSERPLLLVHLIKSSTFKSILCFTNSIETTHRLCTLMKLMEVSAEEFSSRLHITRRNKIIKKFTSDKINLIVSTDALSRGLDLSNVDCVVSYEPPTSLKNYIHRVGRTARAGKAGTAVTLLERKQIHHFKQMLSDAGKEKMKEMIIDKSKLDCYTEQYQKSLADLQKTLEQEQQGSSFHN